MIAQVGLLAEATLADGTLEGPRPIVHVHVTLQVTGGGNCTGGGRERLGWRHSWEEGCQLT